MIFDPNQSNTQPVKESHPSIQNDEVVQRLDILLAQVRVMSQTLTQHIRQNIDTMQEVRDYIGQQMTYRLFREDLEENKLRMEIAQKNLEIEFFKKRIESLTDENSEQDKIILEFEKVKLEKDAMMESLAILKSTKQTTSQKMKAITPPTRWAKIQETILLTTAGTITAAVVGGIIAFVVFLVRLYFHS